eukprot:scaffold950_cov360-Pavlova_lutheri.AAC.13
MERSSIPFLGGSPPTLLPLRDGHNPVPRGGIPPIPHAPPHRCASRILSTTRSSGPGRVCDGGVKLVLTTVRSDGGCGP